MVEDRACLVSRGYPGICQQEGHWPCVNYRLEKAEVQQNKRFLEESDKAEDVAVFRSASKRSCSQIDTALSIGRLLISLSDQASSQRHAGDNSDSSSLIPAIGRDNSISCLINCSRADYGVIASLNGSFRSLIRSGELYKLRRQNGVVEHWVYVSCQLPVWEAFDPNRRRWMSLPRMNPNDCFVFADKESLAVGTQLLVFGKDLMSHVIYCYSLLTNTWTSGMSMNAPRCLFGSASLGEIAILAGGCDSHGNILSSAELYNSEMGTWTTLPSMIKPRKMCSGVFMDGKFYVVGGIGGADMNLLTCGEEYNLETQTWTEIPNMSPVRAGAARENEPPATSEAPPLIAVVNNELYAADYADMNVRKYNKENGLWITVGRLPERADSMYGWGLAFRACGERLIVIGGPRNAGEGFIEVNSWTPSQGLPEWVLLSRKRSGSFVYNCAVMGC
ncbi:F-box/kelch-repeat protein SKIP11-like isoform X2 [Andrographis paniculata]|nr:F-box/kelch-repeat protein SKIP11-like isoform X2 [Andrographis paniculata]XP_051145074.1 F-box/kelch-repeat protein SKIP11-like isoform X2 [Andrographis paniculata]XP_051145075.1 F-box/kelch-repeat protein SKIP11-like isoform X2 [Andrographis paniculata]